MIQVDAHHHLWDPKARDYPFLVGQDLAPIRKRYGLTELRHVAASLGVDRTVLVQTVSDERETREFLSAAVESGSLIAGVVGWTDLTAPDLHDALAALREIPGGDRLVGIRHQIEDEPDPEWAIRPEVVAGIRTLGAAGLTFDLLVRPPQWSAALRLAAECGDTPIVLDHAGKPPIAAGDLAEWSGWIRRLAKFDHVMVKLSGLVTESDWRHWEFEDLRPVVVTVAEAFGPERVIVGSDWPVAELAGPVERSWQAITELARQYAGADALGANAMRFYSL